MLKPSADHLYDSSFHHTRRTRLVHRGLYFPQARIPASYGRYGTFVFPFLSHQSPYFSTGFDLVGHEDSLRPLLDYLEPLTKFVARQKEVGVDIPFIFHAGETLGDGTPADTNLYDAILLGTKRIGHG